MLQQTVNSGKRIDNHDEVVWWSDGRRICSSGNGPRLSAAKDCPVWVKEREISVSMMKKTSSFPTPDSRWKRSTPPPPRHTEKSAYEIQSVVHWSELCSWCSWQQKIRTPLLTSGSRKMEGELLNSLGGGIRQGLNHDDLPLTDVTGTRLRNTREATMTHHDVTGFRWRSNL